MFDDMREVASALVDRMTAATRAESRAAGERLVAVSELDLVRLRQYGECETWSSGTQEAIAAEIAAALTISRTAAEGYLYHARTMRLRLPNIGALLCAGDISYAMFRTIIYRTDLITDTDITAAVDATLAARITRCPSTTRRGLGAYVDKVVSRADRDAVRQRRDSKDGREITIWGGLNGISSIYGHLASTDAHAVDKRLDALAATVCAHDPRTRQQRRADALGALAAGADRLTCRCARSDCAAGAKSPPAGGTSGLSGTVLIHVVADQASIDGTGHSPAVLIGEDELIPAELITELAASARLRPLTPPIDAAPEPGYRPSAALAEFIRCRDLTCRFPGCDTPADRCDVDHTVAFADGGPTHASNCKLMCRKDHLVKTFWGWKDQQLPDGTVVWTAPTGHTYVTTPGSAWLFPQLCVPTGHLDPPGSQPDRPCADRAALMPRRHRTRAENRARYIKAERSRNRQVHNARLTTWIGPAPPGNPDDEPPPF